ncbi:MAG: hypothetical protein ABI318_20700 [Chthoniobacteraceae bacterium]
MSLQRIPLPIRIALTLLISAVCLVLSLHAQAPAALPRIAVLPDSDDKQLVSFADLLTASLSQTAKACELVERAELNRLAQEAEIQKLNVTDRPRALAKFAKADGLILLSLDKTDPKRPSIVARLSSASSGLILKSFMLAAEEKDIPEAAKLAADALRFPAERLSKAGSPPPLVISLLGFRATVANSPGVAIETALNGAVTHHLSSIAGLAVVERWKLDDIAFERSLAEKDMPALTTGTTLVDGSFEIKGTVAAVKLRIRTTHKDQGKTVTAEGPANDTFALARNIATKVAAESGSHAAPAPWDTKAEASAYAKLAAWLLNHRMGREAAQAYESAVALGDGSDETLLKRIYAYILLALPKQDIGRVSAGFQEQLAFRNSTYDMESDRDRFPFALLTVSRLTAYAEDLLKRPWNPYPGFAWTSKPQYAANIAILASHTLSAAHRLKIHIAHSGEVALLRQRTESLVRLSRNGLERITLYENHVLELLSGYWLPTPEQAAEYWLNLLESDPKLSSRQLINRRYNLANDFSVEGFGSPPGKQTWIIGPLRPLFVDWNTLENPRGEECWRNFLGKLRSSESLLNQADGIVFALYTTPPEKEREKLLGDYLELMEHNRQFLTQTQGQAMFFAYQPRIRPTLFPAQFSERYASLVETMFAKSDRVDSEILDPIFLMLKISLGQFRLFTPSGQIFGTTRLLPEENALKTLNAIKGYAGRTSGLPKASNNQNGLHTTPEDLARAITIAYPEFNVPPPSRPTISTLVPDAIPIRYIHSASDGIAAAGRLSHIGNIIAACGDRILCHSDPLRKNGFVSIAPDLTATYLLPPPESIFKTPHDIPFPYGRPPVPTKDGFFAVTQYGMLLHYSYRDKKWTDESHQFPDQLRNTYQELRAATAPGKRFDYAPPTIGFINDTLYIGTAADGHAIGRVVHGKYELIASSRRQPAEHPVDEVSPSNVAALFPGTNGRPYALLNLSDRSEVYDLELGKKVGIFPMQAKAHFDGKVAVIGTTRFLSTIEPDLEIPRNLIRFHSGKDWYERTVRDNPTVETAWDWPRSITQTDFSMGLVSVGYAARGDCLFYLKCTRSAGGYARVALERPSMDKLSLLCFIPGRRDPLEIPLGFQPDAKIDSRSQGAIPCPPPHINAKYVVEFLQSTSAGLFFNCYTPKLFEDSPGGNPPSLLCVTWKDVNDWLTRHGHAPIGTRTATGTASPSQ